MEKRKTRKMHLDAVPLQLPLRIFPLTFPFFSFFLSFRLGIQQKYNFLFVLISKRLQNKGVFRLIYFYFFAHTLEKQTDGRVITGTNASYPNASYRISFIECLYLCEYMYIRIVFFSSSAGGNDKSLIMFFLQHFNTTLDYDIISELMQLERKRLKVSVFFLSVFSFFLPSFFRITFENRKFACIKMF